MVISYAISIRTFHHQSMIHISLKWLPIFFLPPYDLAIATTRQWRLGTVRHQTRVKALTKALLYRDCQSVIRSMQRAGFGFLF